MSSWGWGSITHNVRTDSEDLVPVYIFIFGDVFFFPYLLLKLFTGYGVNGLMK